MVDFLPISHMGYCGTNGLVAHLYRFLCIVTEGADLGGGLAAMACAFVCFHQDRIASVVSLIEAGLMPIPGGFIGRPTARRSAGTRSMSDWSTRQTTFMSTVS